METLASGSEIKFFKLLQDIFVGAKVEGVSGFINLMNIKYKYYEKLSKILKKDIEDQLQQFPDSGQELYDKLYSFFKRYFSESGSVYFVNTPFHERVYERVYSDRRGCCFVLEKQHDVLHKVRHTTKKYADVSRQQKDIF